MKAKQLDNRITFRLPVDMAEEFNEAVNTNDASVSKVMRSLVTQWLVQQRSTSHG